MSYDIVQYTQASQESRHVARWTDITSVQRHIFLLVNALLLSGVVSLFGIFANIINLIVFYRQGLNTTTNISFFVMAFSDLSCLLIQEWYIVISLIDTSTLPINIVDFKYLTGGAPHELFARLTCSVTVYITAERCLCIVFPLKIKRIITIRRTQCIIVCIYILTLGVTIPFYVAVHLDWTFNPERNRTLLGFAFTENKDTVEKMALTANSISGVLSVMAVSIFTSISIHKLQAKSAWRESANVQQEKSDLISKRDRTTIAMVVAIACILLVCYTPSVIICLVTCFEPEFNVGRLYVYAYDVSWSFALLLENLNSSVNIFLYLKMSTNYRRTFKSLCFSDMNDY